MISIVIPIYNAEKNIYRLVKKLLEVFSSEKLEIILINDCSPDKSHEECIKITNEYENFVKHD